MIKLENVQFGYRKEKPLFQDLNLELSGGHIYGLLGKNGAGKTTLMKLMSGMRFPTSGRVEMLGFPAMLREPEMLSNIYFLAEEIYVPMLNIRDFVDLYAPFYPHFNREQMSQYLNEFEVGESKQLMTSMSHGQKKKVMIAFALATNTRILLMDEPTNGLDIPSKSMFRKVMAQAADEQRSFIISTHQVRDLHSLIDSIIILDNGKIIVNATNDEILQKFLFKVYDNQDDIKNVLYSEDTLRGIYAITENLTGEESKLDIELFFNAVLSLSQKNRIQEILNAKN